MILPFNSTPPLSFRLAIYCQRPLNYEFPYDTKFFLTFVDISGHLCEAQLDQVIFWVSFIYLYLKVLVYSVQCSWHRDVCDLWWATILRCWWLNFDVGAIFWMLILDANMKRLLMLFTRIATIPQFCDQHISSPIFVTNSDVT